MKDIFLEDRIIPAYSISSIDMVYGSIDCLFHIIVRQGVSQIKLLSHSDRDFVKEIFEKLKDKDNGIVFKDLVPEVKTKDDDKPKTKTRQRKPKKEVIQD